MGRWALYPFRLKVEELGLPNFTGFLYEPEVSSG